MGRVIFFDVIAQEDRPLHTVASIHITHKNIHNIKAEIVTVEAVKIVTEIQAYILMEKERQKVVDVDCSRCWDVPPKSIRAGSTKRAKKAKILPPVAVIKDGRRIRSMISAIVIRMTAARIMVVNDIAMPVRFADPYYLLIFNESINISWYFSHRSCYSR